MLLTRVLISKLWKLTVKNSAAYIIKKVYQVSNLIEWWPLTAMLKVCQGNSYLEEIISLRVTLRLRTITPILTRRSCK
jgi:hypothetical protein